MQRAVDALGIEFVVWCAPQDMMCEPEALKATGLSLFEHQRRTVDNFVELTTIAGQLPWLPVLQGWQLADYLRIIEMYAAAGIDLFDLERVGVGSVCRRQGTREGVEIIVSLIRRGLRTHAFGFKQTGLRKLRKELSEVEWALASRPTRWRGQRRPGWRGSASRGVTGQGRGGGRGIGGVRRAGSGRWPGGRGCWRLRSRNFRHGRADILSMTCIEAESGRWLVDLGGGLTLEVVLVGGHSWGFCRFGGELVGEVDAGDG